MKAGVIQAYADRKDMKNFYSYLKTVYGPTSSELSLILSANRKTIISAKEKILERWAEHFNSVLNRPSTINDEAIARLPPLLVEDTFEDPAHEAELTKAIKHLSSGKAAGTDSISVEIYASG